MALNKKLPGFYTLAGTKPYLVKEWHPDKNGALTPHDLNPDSRQKVWWKCRQGHEWEETVVSRSLGKECPSCAEILDTEDHYLATVNPGLAKEWHPDRNGALTPQDVTQGSGKKVWWKCKKGHEWQATVASRNRGHRCPECRGRVATPEYCLAAMNCKLVSEWHPDKNGALTPQDVTPGSGRKVWWKCNKGHEWQATVVLRNIGQGCPMCSGRLATSEHCLSSMRPDLASEWHPDKNGALTPEDFTPDSARSAWWKCEKGHEWEAKIKQRNRLGTGCPFCSGRLPSSDNCLLALRPSLAKEWHPDKNGALTPRDVTAASGRIVWWKCREGHEWQTKIKYRYDGTGCPSCSRLRAGIREPLTAENCLLATNPALAREWHCDRNGALTPADVQSCSSKRVWWKCSEGHEWQAVIVKRNRKAGCPFCSGIAITSHNCLRAVNPAVAKEWHPVKNGALTPDLVKPGSDKKVWWKCRKGHEWQATVAHRNKGSGCPACGKSYRSSREIISLIPSF